MPESEGRPELSQDALVEALVSDPDDVPDVVMLQGYLGRGGVEGTWRLYFTPDLDDYVDIPADKILHRRRLPDDRGTMIWVPKGLMLEHKRVTSEDVQAEFLAGPITSRFLRDQPNSIPWLNVPLLGGIQPTTTIFHSIVFPCLPPVSWAPPGFCGQSGLGCK
jgi:hypothetical protein